MFGMKQALGKTSAKLRRLQAKEQWLVQNMHNNKISTSNYRTKHHKVGNARFL